MTATGRMRTCARAVALVGIMATSACGHLYESAEPNSRQKVSNYIEGLDTDGTDSRMASLRSYAGTMVTVLEMDVANPEAVHEIAVAMDRRQACLTQSWGWKAQEHSRALTKVLFDSRRAQAKYVAYLKEAMSVPAARGDPCNY